MIQSPLLPRIAGFVDGQWTEGSGKTRPRINPATGEILAHIPDLGAPETIRAVEAASRALKVRSEIGERRRGLTAIGDALARHREELARIITLEQGKPIRESVVEVDYAAGFFRYFAAHLEEIEPRTLSEPIRACRWTIHQRPAGVAGLITPWNFPLAMLAKKLSAALAAGCGVVAKPSGATPLSAIALWTLLEGLDFPPGKLNLVVGHAAPIGGVFCEHPLVRVISFTGSTAAGKLLYRESAPRLKRLSLELGGNAPFIVFEDADVDAAVEGLMANKFRCAGQTCVCANRVYVHRDIESQFIEALVPRAARLRMGNGLESATEIGPLINRDGFDKVAEHVADALKQGARKIHGEEPVRPEQDWGCFFPPTILTGAHAKMLVFREETFGPVIAMGSFQSESEALAAANGTPFGLAAYVFTRDAERLQRCAEQLSFGHVGLNTGTGPAPEAPFGGMKESGFGREGGIEGFAEFCEPQTSALAFP